MSDVQPQNNEKDSTALTIDEAEDAILARWEDAEKEPSDPETEDEPEVVEEEDEETTGDLQEETDENEVEEDEETDPDETETKDEDEDDDVEDENPVLSDDAQVEIQVDGETVQASVKDLKRLYGQEAALTRKSQEVAKQRKDAEDSLSKSSVVLQKMLEKAQAKFKPYQEVDMLVASKTMSTEDFAQLRKEYKAVEEEYKFLNEEADVYYKDLQNQQQTQLQSAAKECVKVLQDEVPNWSNQLYNDIRGYAISIGLPENEVNRYVDPKVIQLINKARLYDQGKKVATTKKKNPTSTKILRSKKAPPTATSRKVSKLKDATAALGNQGVDLDDISSVIMSRWEA
tara:strand:+ start:6926 stop:7957 length:1032 start_codon:yes stop_codon:yes gene_type:complete